jgi:drug/metabolite transporter (DMT)-like permease
LVVAAVLFFGAALVVSWTQGADHLTLQLVAMGLGLVACLLAAMAAATNKREDQP